MNLKFVRLFNVLILLKSLLLISACGHKSVRHEDIFISPEVKEVRGCGYSLVFSPAYGLNPNGNLDKYFTYMCNDGSYTYCSMSKGYCFNSTLKYF